MKKYLMTGVAALAICAAFTSCSKNEELFDQGAVNQNTADQVVAKYNQAFLKYVGGTIDPEQTWGFGGYSVAGTRAHADGTINVNGNEWAPEDVPAVDDPAEVTAIYDYAHHTIAELDELKLPYGTTAPQDLNGYYVTQVRSGMNADNVYDAFDGTHLENCGEKMNYLQIKFETDKTLADLANATEGSGWKATGWEHINNFNASFNTNHGAATSAEFGNTMVVGKGAFDFAYYNSVDGKFHNNWILVDGYDITADHKYQNFYYVCFDFEGTPECVSKFRFRIKGGDEYGDVRVAGAWTAEEAVKQNLEVTTSDGKKVKVGEDIETSFKAGTDGVYNGLQVESVDNGDKKFDPDERHTDWIIRITKGPREIVEDPDDVCIIAEDLNAESATDFDFNDVVFTVHYKSNSLAEIEVFAAGATQLIKIGKSATSPEGDEVHQLFAQANNNADLAKADPTTGLYKMINTGSKADFNGLTHPKFDLAVDKSQRGNDIEIWVNKFEKVSEGVYKDVNNWIRLTATKGQPAAKLCVGVDFKTKYCDERVSIKEKYPLFYNWVKDHPTLIWWY